MLCNSQITIVVPCALGTSRARNLNADYEYLKDKNRQVSFVCRQVVLVQTYSEKKKKKNTRTITSHRDGAMHRNAKKRQCEPSIAKIRRLPPTIPYYNTCRVLNETGGWIEFLNSSFCCHSIFKIIPSGKERKMYILFIDISDIFRGYDRGKGKSSALNEELVMHWIMFQEYSPLWLS